MNPLFINFSIFCSEKSIFSEDKFRKIEHLIQEFQNIFEKLIEHFQFLQSRPINPMKFPMNVSTMATSALVWEKVSSPF